MLLNEQTTSLVFIVSQPRAGSTLLQSVLAANQGVLAPAEPWLMLPMVDAVEGARCGLSARHDAWYADVATSEFASTHLPEGRESLIKAYADAARSIYQLALRNASKTCFVDKTPRYYWIIEDLLRWFPEAKIILLIRNPLDVMASIYQTWAQHDEKVWQRMRSDLLDAPQRLASAIEYEDERILPIRYEELSCQPTSASLQIDNFLGLETSSELDGSGLAISRQSENCSMGDPVIANRARAIDTNSQSNFLPLAASHPGMWRMLDDYLKVLGQPLLGKLGYDHGSLAEQLDSVRPRGAKLTVPLKHRLQRPSSTVVRKLNRWLVRHHDKMHRSNGETIEAIAPDLLNPAH